MLLILVRVAVTEPEREWQLSPATWNYLTPT